ncbi:beta-glucosidase 1-like, partial [Dendrobium catenatum]
MFRNFTWGETDTHILWEDANLHLRIEVEYQTYAFRLSKDFQEAEEKGFVMDRLLVCDRKNYADYAEFCFKTFGKRVNNWLTFNEPIVIVALGYDNGIFAPGRCTGCTAGGNSTTEPYIVAHNRILYHAAAVKVYRDKYQVSQKGRIGILLDFVCYESLTNSIADEDAIVHLMLVRDVSHGLYPEAISMGEDASGMPTVLQSIRECREISDWVTRKFAADALIVLAPYSDHLITNGTSQIFETCCFDKVKPME